MLVCVCVCVQRVYTHVCTYIHIYVHTNKFTCTHIHIFIYDEKRTNASETAGGIIMTKQSYDGEREMGGEVLRISTYRLLQQIR